MHETTECYDPTCLSYWFPKVLAAGLPVPKTEIIRADSTILHVTDGKESESFNQLVAALRKAICQIGTPCFLRTGLYSDKHGWRRTCYYDGSNALEKHVYQLIESSCLVDLMGLAVDVWVVRELIPTTPAFHAFPGDMPITREFRFFVEDGGVTHWQPYWPYEAFLKGYDAESWVNEDAVHPVDWPTRLAEISRIDENEHALLSRQSLRAAAAAPACNWSIDWLQDVNGNWWLTDMAVAERSYRFDHEVEVKTNDEDRHGRPDGQRQQ